MEKEIFIIALLSHVKPLGYVVLPYACFRENEKFITVHERLSGLNIGKYPEIKPSEFDFFKLSETYSNQAIIKQFSKKKETPKDFFAHLDKKLLDEMIRPFIERKLSQIFPILLENNIPLYNGKGGSNLYEEDHIQIESGSPEASLKFIRTPEGTQYKLRAFHAHRELVLNNPENAILVNEPCWYLAGNKLVRFKEQISGKLLIPFQKKEFVDIPKRIEYQYFSTFIRKIANRCDIEAEGFQLNDLELQPKAVLSLETNMQGNNVLVLHFQYGEKMILAHNPQQTFTTLLADKNGFIFNRFKRDKGWEAGQVAFLKAKGLKKVEATFSLPGSGVQHLADYQMIEWLAENNAELSKQGFAVNQPGKKKYIFEVPVLELTMDSGFDWFDVKGSVVIHEQKIPFIRFRHHIVNNIKEYELPGGEIVILPDEWFSRFQDIMLYAKEQNQQIRLGKHHFKLLAAIPSAEVQQLGQTLDSPAQVEVPPLADVILRPYQLTGFYWMHALLKQGLGGILADDMGLGKTLQTITLLASRYAAAGTLPLPSAASPSRAKNAVVQQLDLFSQPEIVQPAKPETSLINSDKNRPACSLVVLPASLIHNWFNELRRFAPWLRLYVHVGAARAAGTGVFGQYDVVLTTYGTLRNDIAMFSKFVFGHIILDESQNIKNPDSKAAQAVFSLQGMHRMALTGTPIQNSLADIWSQFNFLNPGMLGTYQHFQKYYASPLLKSPDDKVGTKLREMIGPFILRRTKEEVATELPALTETAVFCAMTDEQQSMYESEKSKIRNSILEKFEKEGGSNASVLVLRSLMMLRQLANHPRMVDATSLAGSGKFAEVTESLATLLAENHRVLVFSSFVRHLKLVEEFCIDSGYSYAMLTGSTTNREKVINTFKKDKHTQLFLISLKAGGVGLNLTEADYVFILDPWWNPAAEMQALNRAHRIGQDKNVFVYRFITKDTVEEKIVMLQQRKKQLADLFVTSDSTIAGMSKEEIMDIFA